MLEARVTANEVEFAYLEAGPADGPLALCLHGFPDTAHTYRHLLPALARAGFHAVAPWMRGYAPSSVPADGAYQAGALATDACALHEALGGDDRAVLIGHDWGAFAAYCAAPFEPKRWRKVVTVAIPPPAIVAQSFFTYDQFKRSFYVFLFQTPLAEMALASSDLGFVERLWADWSPGYDCAFDVARVRESLAEGPNLHAAVGYYRAMLDPTLHLPAYAAAQAAAGSPPQPTLNLHGDHDGCFVLDPASDVASALSEGSRHVRVADAGHFLHLERPDEVNRLILDFLSC
ncbi:MAG TPA: alpha/beta hydrolase [Acidimicrobiaceae bacterium]|nr:alpha/beta hydrolase [Acidimicrobiaceae bacterium]